MTRRITLWLAVPLVVLLAACGGGDSGSDASSTPDDAGAAVEAGEEYLRAFAREDDRSLDRMVALAAPGSVADRFARHTSALNDIQIASGETPDGATVSVDGRTVVVELSPEGGSPTRTEWSDFEIDNGGLLVNFTINGVPLDDRVAGSGEPVVIEDVSAQIVSAFHLVTSDSPVVIVEIVNRADGVYVLDGADYRAPDGAEVPTGPAGEGLELPAGETNRVALVFDPIEFGGSVVLHGDLEGREVSHELAIEI